MKRVGGGIEHRVIERRYVGLEEYGIFPPQRSWIHDVESDALTRGIHLAFEDMLRFRRYHHSGAATHGHGSVSVDLIYERAFHAENQFEIPVSVRIVEYGFVRSPFCDGFQPSQTYLFSVDNTAYVFIFPHRRNIIHDS